MKKVAPEKQLLESIAAQIPTPFHLYDGPALEKRAQDLNAAFSWNEGFREYFAVKATPNPHILELLKAQGCGVDCASLCELKMARAVGFRREEIMFSSNQTPAGEFELARELGAIINLDDISHINFLQEHGGIPKVICLRYNPGGDAVVANQVMGRPEEAKFGMTRDQIFESVRRLQAMGTEEFGLHAFLVSNTRAPDYYPAMAAMLMELALEIHRELGAKVFMVNLSGGIGIPYRPEEEPVDIAKVGERVREAYDSLIRGTSLHPMRVVTELGRYMTGPIGWLVARAIHTKDIYKQYIGLDATACNLMRPAMYGAYHHITVPGKENAPCDRVYDVVGSLCENNDKFAVDRKLPEILPGDLVVIHDTGAHGHSMGYNYNGKLRSAEVLPTDEGYRLIRRAETPEDYFATLDYPGLNGGTGQLQGEPPAGWGAGRP